MTATVRSATRVTTLLYHSFANTTTSTFRELTVDPGLFAEHIAALADSGCRFVKFCDLPALVAGATAPEGPTGPIVSITVDDGLADVTTGAAPMLAQSGIPATLFVPTAYVGATAGWLPGGDGDRPLCDWQTLRDLSATGWEVASHGHRHIAADLSAPSVVTDDALRSRRLLEEHLGETVTSFAYPFGYYSKQGRIAVQEAGFDQAGIVSGPRDRSHADRWRLPRTQIGPGMTPEDLVALAHHHGRSTVWRDRAKQQLWLVGRRRLGWGPPESAAVAGTGQHGPVSADGSHDV